LRNKEDFTSYTQQYVQKLKRRRSFYKDLNMFSRTKSQAFQRLFETRFDVSIPSYNVEKQTICKKKKAWLDNLSFSSTRSISTKVNVLRIINNYYDFA